MEFAIETVEIGVIAADDGMTWANTETRDTLGKTRAGWWLELQKYGADRVSCLSATPTLPSCGSRCTARR